MTLLLACVSLQLDAPVDHPHVVYDPGGGDIPLPNDLVVEDGHLALPTDDEELSAVEADLRRQLNELDGWPTVSDVGFSLSHELGSLDGISVWEWGANPEIVPVDVVVDGTEVELAHPLGGWERGGTYLVVVDERLSTSDGRGFGPDAAFWYLRAEEDLTEHPDAFPGATEAERLDTAAELEDKRRELAPFLDFADDQGLPRDRVAAAWTFTTTSRVEVAMDPDGARVPLPFDLLIDPATGLVDLPPSDDDSEVEADAKLVANTLDGFGLNANLLFDTTDVVVEDTADITLYAIDQTPVSMGLDVRVMEGEHLVLEPHDLPLHPGTTYALVVRGLKDEAGEDVVPMPLGMLVASDAPLVVDGEVQLDMELEDAERIEMARLELDPLLDSLGRDDVIAAWPFRTLDPLPAQQRSARMAETLDLEVGLTVSSRLPAYDLIWDDALSELFPGLLNPAPAVYAGRVWGVHEVVQGTLNTATFLDPETRRWTAEHTVEPIGYLAIIPETPDPELPVIIFGHAIVTDRRFLLTIAGELAQRGFYSVAIDFPFHGPRTVCVESSLVAVPNFIPEELQDDFGYEESIIWLPPCASGEDASCSPTGECLDAEGNPEDFSVFPLIDMYPASGAAFMDMDDLPHIPDHFQQALVDLGALRWAIASGAFDEVFGQSVPRDRFYYAGQSLGSIIGIDFVAHTPEIERAVFNVPGADLVDLFRYSDYFGPQIDYWTETHELEEGSYEQERMLNVAKWLVDAVDPTSNGYGYAEDPRPVLLQIDKIDEETGDIIIPNFTSEGFQAQSGHQLETYPSVLHADLIVPVLGDAMLEDLADFLEDGEL